MSFKLFATIVSCSQRATVRAGTEAELRAAGLEPVVYLSPCQPAGPQGHAAVSALALRDAQESGLDWLFCEDDLTLSPGFPAALQKAQASGGVTYLYLHEDERSMTIRYPDEILEQIRRRSAGLTPRHVRLLDAQFLESAQCVLIPAAAAAQMRVEALERLGLSFDMFLEAFLRETRRSAFAMVPCPVQHLEAREGRGSVPTGSRTSLSHDLAVT